MGTNLGHTSSPTLGAPWRRRQRDAVSRRRRTAASTRVVGGKAGAFPGGGGAGGGPQVRYDGSSGAASRPRVGAEKKGKSDICPL